MASLSHIIEKKNFQVIENDQKTFKKRVLRSGTGDEGDRPGLWSQAKVLINFIDNINTDAIALGQYKVGVCADVTVGDGDSDFSRLLDQVVQTMKTGEWCYIRTKISLPNVEHICHAHEKHGNGVGDLEQEYVGLRFNVQLQSFDRNPDLSLVGPMKKMEIAERYKALGNAYFNAGEIDASAKRFLRALDYLQSVDISTLSDDVQSGAQKLMCICHLNLAIGFLKQEQFAKVLEHCNSGLQLEPNNIKGLFRRGQAFIKLGRLAEAKTDLSRALEKEPSNKEVTKSLKLVEEMLAKQ